MTRTVDLVIRHGDVIDGTGAPRVAADLLIDGDRVVAVVPRDGGNFGDYRGREEFDATGRIVCPGFIDVHTHDDTALIVNPAMAMKASQGVTTVICGNCGVSAAPVTGGASSAVLELILKDPAHASADFAGFAGKVEAAKPAINAAFLIGHSTLRISVMGKDLDRPANDDEIARMRGLLDSCLEQGAIGMSSGLFYPPAMAASTDEVAQVAQPLGRWGGVYTAHMRDEADDILDAMDETFEIGRRAGARVVVSHHKCSGRQNFGRMRETLPRFDAARLKQDISFDVYPYVAGSTILRKEMIARADKVLVTWSTSVDGVAGRDLAELASEWGMTAEQAADKLQPAGAIYFMMDEADVQQALKHPAAMIGSDGLPLDAHPHPRLWGTFARVLGHYSRDLKLFPLEDAVHRMTGLSAHNFRLARRGVLAAGNYADVCVFDAAKVADLADFQTPTTPSAGIDLVLANGQPVWRDGAVTGNRPGRVLRRDA